MNFKLKVGWGGFTAAHLFLPEVERSCMAPKRVLALQQRRRVSITGLCYPRCWIAKRTRRKEERLGEMNSSSTQQMVPRHRTFDLHLASVASTGNLSYC